MKSILKWFIGVFQEITRDPVEQYLSEAIDLHDLEYRLQKIGRGCVPFLKTYYCPNRSWAQW